MSTISVAHRQHEGTLLHGVEGKSYEIHMFSLVLMADMDTSGWKTLPTSTDSILLEFSVRGLSRSTSRTHQINPGTHWPLWSWGLSQDLFAHRVAGSRCDVTFVPGCCEAFLLEKGQVSQGWRSDPWKPFRKQEPLDLDVFGTFWHVDVGRCKSHRARIGMETMNLGSRKERRRRWRWKDRGHKIWNFSSESLHDSKFHRLTLVEARKLYAWRVLITFCMWDMRYTHTLQSISALLNAHAS